jgi:hypothetical protein
VSTPTVKFGNVILGGATSYDWELRAGVQPVERAFTVSKERADALAGRLGQEDDLEILGPRAPLKVDRLTLIEIQPGDDPFTKRIRLVDRRWLWPKVWVATSFNVRRTTGDRFLAGEGRIENKLIQPRIKYAAYSLNGEEPWTARDALLEVLDQLGVGASQVRFEDDVPETEMQDVILDDPGPAAVERLLGYMPGMDLYVDLDGSVVIFDRYSGKERDAILALPVLQRDGAWVGRVTREATRPAEVVVLFTVESEFRLDHTEPTDDVSGQAVEDEPNLFQVAPLPDAELTIDGITLARSSWVELSKLFTAWGPFGVHNREITFADLRRHALKHGWANFEQAWGNNPLEPPDAVKLARAAAAVRHWRHTFRIDRFWVQRLEAIRPYRVAIVNPETGAFAPASVYCDWIRRPSYKGFATASSEANTKQGWAVRGYATELASAEPAPARVDVVDDQAGILTVKPQVDPWGETQAMLFGYPEGGNLPSQIMGDAKRLGQELYARWDRVVLESAWKMAVVLTVVPGSPNDTRRFFAVRVTADKVEPHPGPSSGPAVYARVFPGVMTARFAWTDAKATEIRQAVKGDAPWSGDLLTNRELVEDVALATAKRIYDTLRDRPLGGGQVDLTPSFKPTGTVGSVRHAMQGGEVVTSFSVGAVTQPADIWRYLNASTRKAILRVLNTPPSVG